MIDSRPVLEQYNELLGILGRFTQHKMNMDEAIQVSCIIDKLPPSWKDFKHTLKHLKEELTLVELGSHLRIEESLRVQDSDKPKGNNVAGPSVVNMVEHNNSSRYNDNKGKRKHHDNTRVDPNKKAKPTCWKCGKTGHIKRDCKGVNVGNKANGSGTKGSVDGSSNSLKGQNMFNKSLQVYYVTYVSEAYFVQDDDVAWWVDSGATVMLNIINDNIAPAFMSTSKLNDSILWHARLGHDEELDKFKVLKTEVELQGSLIKRFRTDRGAEYMDTLYFQSVGIIHETTTPYSPQQNGISKKKNRVLKEMVNFMLSYLGELKTMVVQWSLVKVTKEAIQQPEPELRKSKKNKTPKDFGPEFQLYLIEGTRDEVIIDRLYKCDKATTLGEESGAEVDLGCLVDIGAGTGTPIEVEPLNETKIEEVGLNYKHNTPFSSREVPSFDGLKPQPLLNSPSLDVSPRDVIGPEPPIKPHSPDSSRMKVVDYLTTQTPPSPHMANSYPKGVYSYYNQGIDDPKRHYGFKPGLLGKSVSLGVDISNWEMFDDDWGLESKEVSLLGEELSLFDRPNKV
ncbi:zinc finger, CCHC-type containing protein [Tanacetum coccineum]